MDIETLSLSAGANYKACDEVLTFLASSPSLQQIVQFQLSTAARQRAHDLLWKEREQGLAPSEAEELDFYVELGDFLGVLRAKAQYNNGF